MKLESWEFDVLGIYNPLRLGHLKTWFDFLRHQVADIPGDVVEAGVFQGKSLLAGGYVLNEVAPDKRLFGYDTFSGFPPVQTPEDDLARFDDLANDKRISPEYLARVRKNLAHLRYLKKVANLDFSNVSSSGSFEDTSQVSIENLANYLELSNISLIPGPFEETMTDVGPGPDKIAAAILDCDLYSSYLVSLGFIWPRLSPGGIIYLDEYYSLKFPGARIAVDEFFDGSDALLSNVTDEFNGFERWFVTKPTTKHNALS